MADIYGADPAQPFANVLKYSDNGYGNYAGRFAWQTDRDGAFSWGADVPVDANGYPTGFSGVTAGYAYNAFTRRVLYGQAINYISIQGYLANSSLFITNNISELVSPILPGGILNGSNGNSIVNVTLGTQTNATTWTTSLGTATFQGYIQIVTTGTGANIVNTPTLFITAGSISGTINVGATIVGSGIAAGTTLVSGGGTQYVVSISQTVGSQTSPIPISSSYDAGSSSAPLFWTITQPTPNTTNYYPPGRYAIVFTGQGTLQTGFVSSGGHTYVSADDSTAATYGLTGYGSQTNGVNYGTTTFTNTGSGTFYGVFNLATGTSVSTGLSLSWIAPSLGGQAIAPGAGNYPTNVIVCLEADLPGVLAQTKIFSDRFLAQLSPYSWVRFMNWRNINGSALRVYFQSTIPVGATSAPISLLNKKGYSGWPYETRSWQCVFITGEIRTVTATTGSPTLSWSQPLLIPVLQNSWDGDMAYIPLTNNFADRPQTNDVTWASQRGVPIEMCQALCKAMSALNNVKFGYWHNSDPFVNYSAITAQTPFNGTLSGTTLTMETAPILGSLRGGNLFTNAPNPLDTTIEAPYVFQGYVTPNPGTNPTLTITAVVSGSPMAFIPGSTIIDAYSSVSTPNTTQYNLLSGSGSTYSISSGAGTFGTSAAPATFYVTQFPNGLAVAGNGILNGTFIYSLQNKQYGLLGYVAGNNIAITSIASIGSVSLNAGLQTFTPVPQGQSAGGYTWLYDTGTINNTVLGVSVGSTVYTKVASNPAAGQYSVSSSGAYTINAIASTTSATIAFEFTASNLYGALKGGQYINGLDATAKNQLATGTYIEDSALVTGYISNGTLTIVANTGGITLAIVTGSTLTGYDPVKNKNINTPLGTGSGNSWNTSLTAPNNNFGSASQLIPFTIQGSTKYVLPSQNAGGISAPLSINTGTVYSILPSSQPDSATPTSPAALSLFQYITPGNGITGTGTSAGTVTVDYGATPGTFSVNNTYSTSTGQIPLVGSPLTAAFFTGYVLNGTMHVSQMQSGTIQPGSQLICQNCTTSTSITTGSGSTWTTNCANVGSSGSPVQMQAAPCLLTDGYGYYASQSAGLCYNNVTLATGANTSTELSNEVWNDTLPYGNAWSRFAGQLSFPCYRTQSVVVSQQEWFGSSVARIADIFAATINTLSGDNTGQTFFANYWPLMGSQYGTGGAVDQLNDAMTTPDWYPDGITQSQAYTHNVRGVNFAPYYDVGGTGSGSFVLSTPDIQTLLNTANPLAAMFDLYYSNVDRYNNPYASVPVATLTGTIPGSVADYGVLLGVSDSSGPYTYVTSSTPGVRQFSASNGKYTINTASTNTVVNIAFEYSSSSSKGAKLTTTVAATLPLAGANVITPTVPNSGTWLSGTGTVFTGFINYSVGQTLAMIQSIQTKPWAAAMNAGAGPIYKSYEGGAGFEFNNELGALTPAQQQGLTNLVYAMINDQRMRYAVSDIAGTHVPSGNGYLPGMQAIGMYGITMFTAVSGFSIYGSWGATQSVMQTVSNLSTAPGKYAGTLDYAFNTP